MSSAGGDSTNYFICQQVRKDITARTAGDSRRSGGPVPPGWCFSAREKYNIAVGAFHRFGRTRTGGALINCLSAVTRVKSKTRAVATRKRSAGSRCGSCTRAVSCATWWVIGASRMGTASNAFAIQACGFGCKVNLLFWQRVRTSHNEMGESHNSFCGFSNVAVSRAARRARSSVLHNQM
jgi:hypothetical protein